MVAAHGNAQRLEHELGLDAHRLAQRTACFLHGIAFPGLGVGKHLATRTQRFVGTAPSFCRTFFTLLASSTTFLPQNMYGSFSAASLRLVSRSASNG